MLRIKQIRKRPKPETTEQKIPIQFNKIRFLRAIEDSGGIPRVIAERLGCARSTVYKWIKEADDECKQALQDEIESVGDVAEETVKRMITQRLDYSVAARTARWYLERKCPERGYKERRELTIEGGKSPLHVQNEAVLPLDTLDLPLNVRKQILAAMEKKENETRNEK